MIVDHVEKHHEAAQMRGVDQRLEVLGASVAAVRRVEQHAVIAPVAPAGKIGDRHQLDRGEAGLRYMVELVDGGAKAALRRERAHMQLDERGVLPGPPAPIGGLPDEICVIDHLARTRDVAGLKVRRRIRHRELAVDAELVERAGPRIRHGDLVPPPGRARIGCGEPSTARPAGPPEPIAER